MSIKQFLPKFARAILKSPQCASAMNQLQSGVVKRYNNETNLEICESVPDHLMYHGSESVYFECDLSFRQFCEVSDPLPRKLMQLIQEYWFNYSFLYLDDSSFAILSLNAGPARASNELWFRLIACENCFPKPDLWRERWTRMLDTFAFENLVEETVLDGLPMPQFSDGANRVNPFSYARDPRGYNVLAGHRSSPRNLQCFLNVEAPQGDRYCERTLEESYKRQNKLWDSPPYHEIGFNMPGYHIPEEVLRKMEGEVIVWDWQWLKWSRNPPDPIEPKSPVSQTPLTIPAIAVERPSYTRFDQFLAVNVVHTQKEMSLEFQAHDLEVLQWIADTIGHPLELWEGDYRRRWGWYTEPAPEDTYEIIKPNKLKSATADQPRQPWLRKRKPRE